MPVWKFKDSDEAARALWMEPEDPDLPRRIAGLWAFSSRLAPYRYPRGLWKFRSIEEANRHRDDFEKARIAAIQALSRP